ncbi:MAG: cupin domain-containing protein [Candidatus Kapaibacteriota bacterium]
MKISVQKLTEDEVKNKGINKWPVWTKEISKFDWFYDENEQCLFLEGKVKIHTNNETIEISKGDFVTFPKGLSCVWEIIEPVKKYYNFY